METHRRSSPYSTATSTNGWGRIGCAESVVQGSIRHRVGQPLLFFLAAKYPQQQGVPVTGSYTDGPEWGQQPYTNMFASDLGSLDPSYPVNTLEGTILRQFGGMVLGSYGYSISPSSSREAGQEVKSFEHAGGKLGVLDTSVPFGGMNFTSAAFVAKQQHVNALFPTMIDASDFALTTISQAGRREIKAAVSSPRVMHRTSSTLLRGATCRVTSFCPSTDPSPFLTRVQSKWRPRSRSISTSQNRNSRPCSSTRPGRVPT